MPAKADAVAAVFGILTAVVLAGCSSQSTSVVGDDAALCQYSAKAVGADGLSRCHSRLDGQHRRLAAANATRIDGYALLNEPSPPSAVVDRCKASDAVKDCSAGDIAGTIAAKPKR